MLIFIWLFMLPVVMFSQANTTTIEQGLSSESIALLEQAKKDSATKRTVEKSKSNASKIFNLAVTSRFDFGMIMPLSSEYPFTYDVFNLTSLELYFTLGANVRLLTTARFSTPILNMQCAYNQGSLYKQRLGWGAGISAILHDGRNDKGVGTMTAMNFIVAGDYELNTYDSILNEKISLYRLEMGMRFNRFVSRNFGFVFGLEIGAGFTDGEIAPKLGDDNYPLEPLHDIGEYIRWNATVGASVGLMF